MLVTDKGDILYISGRTGKYLEPAAGKANWNIFAMAREGLRYELTETLSRKRSAKGKRNAPRTQGRSRRGAGFVDVTVQRLEEPEAAAGIGDDRLHRCGATVGNEAR